MMDSSLNPARARRAKLALLIVLALPTIFTIWRDAGVNTENRYLAPVPAVPRDWAGLLAAPAQIDAWVNDHFGMREGLVRLNNKVRFALFREFPSIQMASGRHGRVFLAAHGTNVAPYSALTYVCGGSGMVAAPGTGTYFNALFRDFRQKGLDPRLMIVASAPAVHSDDVPAWLAPRCAGTDTAVTRLLESGELEPATRERIFYPLAQMRALAGNENMFPKTWFHWAGAGLGGLAELSVTHFWGAPPVTPTLPTRSAWMDSDVGYMFPGVHLSSLIVQPDFDAAKISACYGPTCYPEFAGFKYSLPDVSRFHNPAGRPRRLVIISDSFGSKVAGWYARHYRDVEQIATNGIDQVSEADMASMQDLLFRDPAGTDLLFLYHDGGAVYNTLRIGLQRFHQKDPAVMFK